MLIVLGPRRPEPIDAPMKNSSEAFTVYTSVGFRREVVADYIAAASTIGPDIMIGPADAVWESTISQKRIEKMSDRTENWMSQVFRATWPEHKPAIFAPILNVKALQQRMYLNLLAENQEQLAGLAIYDLVALDNLPNTISHLPKLSLCAPKSPHEVLQQIEQGIDIMTIPFVTQASDAGIALTFTFPKPASSGTGTPEEPLGIDMFTATHAMADEPIAKTCKCHTCATISKAYIQHLLSAKEMTGWILLQIHNHSVVSSFFEAIRRSIAAETFEKDAADFGAYYAPELPSQSGAGPR